MFVLELTIRTMKHSDSKAVKHIAETTWHATYEGIIPEEIQNNFLRMAYNESRLKSRMERSIVYVALVDDTVVGFANYVHLKNAGEVELAAIYLLPKVQGEGIGTALLNHGIREIADVRYIYINVERDNEIGTHFYEAKGFTVVDEFIENFDGHDLQTVRMVLDISSRKKAVE